MSGRQQTSKNDKPSDGKQKDVTTRSHNQRDTGGGGRGKLDEHFATRAHSSYDRDHHQRHKTQHKDTACDDHEHDHDPGRTDSSKREDSGGSKEEQGEDLTFDVVQKKKRRVIMQELQSRRTPEGDSRKNMGHSSPV